MPAKSKQQMDITELLHKDHQVVRELFFAFSKSEEANEKEQLVTQILSELFIHAKAEEQVVYPLLTELGEKGEELKGEAETEHRVVKFLMAEISKLPSESEELKSKVTVLCELIEHHVKEEEKEMFKLLRESKHDLEAVADEVTKFKVQLKTEGLPPMTASLQIDGKHEGAEENDEQEKKEDGEAAASEAIKAKAEQKLPAHKSRRKSA